jgi:hypothetical protein
MRSSKILLPAHAQTILNGKRHIAGVPDSESLTQRCIRCQETLPVRYPHFFTPGEITVPITVSAKNCRPPPNGRSAKSYKKQYAWRDATPEATRA